MELYKAEINLKEERAKLQKIEKEFMQSLEDIGLSSFTLNDGTRLSITESYHCNINKNLPDQDNVACWLRDNGADHLVKSKIELETDQQTLDALREHGIPFIEKVEMNTNSVKAFLKDGLGLTGNQAQFEFKDLPKGLHLFCNKEIEIE